MIGDNWRLNLPPVTKELTQPQPTQNTYQWSANQQGAIKYEATGDDILYMGTYPNGTKINGLLIDKHGTLIVRGAPGYVNTTTGRRHAIILHCYSFTHQDGQPAPSHAAGRLWVTDIFSPQHANWV